MTIKNEQECSPRLSPDGTHFIHKAGCAYAIRWGLPMEDDDRPLQSLSDERLQAERHRLQELAAECSASIGEIKRELMTRAIEAKRTAPK